MFAELWRSYRFGFGEHALTQCATQRPGCGHANRDTHQPFEFQLNCRDIEQTGDTGCVDQNIEVALFGIFSAGNRSEYPWVSRLVRVHDAPDGGAVCIEGDRWSCCHNRSSLQSRPLLKGQG